MVVVPCVGSLLGLLSEAGQTGSVVCFSTVC